MDYLPFFISNLFGWGQQPFLKSTILEIENLLHFKLTPAILNFEYLEKQIQNLDYNDTWY